MDYLSKYYRQLVGFEIVGFHMGEPSDFGQCFPTFILFNRQTGERAYIEVSADEEGNDAGFLFFGLLQGQGSSDEDQAA